MRQRRAQACVPFHETMLIGVLLAWVGGFLDTYTFQLRGGVFANAQTGNLVLLSIHAAQREWLKAGYYFVPIAAFFFGVLVTEWIRHRGTAAGMTAWRHRIVVAEAVLLAMVGLLPLSVPNAVINVTVSFVCSMQVNGFRSLRAAPYATTMCTGNLRSAAEGFFQWAFNRDCEAGRRCGGYLVIILSFCVGAGMGIFFTGLWQEHSVWVCSLILFGIAFAMFRKK